MDIAQRIEKRLKLLNKTERQASLEAKLSDSFIRNIRLGRSSNPRIDTLKRLAVVLDTNVDWLYLGVGDENQKEGVVNKNIVEPNVVIKKDISFNELGNIPVYGGAVGGDDGFFELNGERLYDIMSPPCLAHSDAAYAIRICGSSMSPRYEEGEIAYIDPLHPVNRGDYVVVQIRGEDGQPPGAYIKKYLYKTSKELVLEQFNPPKELFFNLRDVVSIHYVVMAGAAI